MRCVKTRRHTQFPRHRQWPCGQGASQSFPRRAYRPDGRATESMTACMTNRQTSFTLILYANACSDSSFLPDLQNGKNLSLIAKAAPSACCPPLQFLGTKPGLVGCNVQE